MSPIAAGKKEKIIGKVTHYYDHIGVAVVELAAPLKVGDTVCFKRGDQELVQEVSSLQMEHEPVIVAKKGQAIGLKVNEPVHEGTLVVKA
ncbi:MAG: SAF domain-containing protein [Candidatus Peribacteraceae bacterium]|nr:SAF domain-containing protein [Candidatus Peribacteraceae bacterium]